MITLIALRPLSGKYGIVHQGGKFQVDDETAESLESRGLAEHYRSPRQTVPLADSFKMHYPVAENKMRPLQPALANKNRKSA